METTIMGLYSFQGLRFKLPEWVYIMFFALLTLATGVRTLGSKSDGGFSYSKHNPCSLESCYVGLYPELYCHHHLRHDESTTTVNSTSRINNTTKAAEVLESSKGRAGLFRRPPWPFEDRGNCRNWALHERRQYGGW